MFFIRDLIDRVILFYEMRIKDHIKKILIITAIVISVFLIGLSLYMTKVYFEFIKDKDAIFSKIIFFFPGIKKIE